MAIKTPPCQGIKAMYMSAATPCETCGTGEMFYYTCRHGPALWCLQARTTTVKP